LVLKNFQRIKAKRITTRLISHAGWTYGAIRIAQLTKPAAKPSPRCFSIGKSFVFISKKSFIAGRAFLSVPFHEQQPA
jgi:hypothetical protein